MLQDITGLMRILCVLENNLIFEICDQSEKIIFISNYLPFDYLLL